MHLSFPPLILIRLLSSNRTPQEARRSLHSLGVPRYLLVQRDFPALPGQHLRLIPATSPSQALRRFGAARLHHPQANGAVVRQLHSNHGRVRHLATLQRLVPPGRVPSRGPKLHHPPNHNVLRSAHDCELLHADAER